MESFHPLNLEKLSGWSHRSYRPASILREGALEKLDQLRDMLSFPPCLNSKSQKDKKKRNDKMQTMCLSSEGVSAHRMS